MKANFRGWSNNLALAYTKPHYSSLLHPRKVALIAMPETPQANPLRSSRLEEDEVKAAMKPWPSIFIETLEHPDVANTMAKLQRCNVAHFACHEISDLLDPSRSSLILRTTKNAIEESRQDILNVPKISQAHLSRTEIAYLSACSTAQNQAIRVFR